MKKILKTLILASLFLFVISCGSDEGKEKNDSASRNTLYIFSWSDYIPDSVIGMFEAETGIDVVIDYYASNEEMFAKVSTGGANYDLTVPSTDYANIMMKNNLLAEFDKEKLTTFNQLDESILAKITFDPNHSYVIPFAVGGTGIAVNEDKVRDYPKDFSIYEDKALKGKMTLLDDMREVLTSALLMNGFSATTTNKEELEIAKNTVLEWKENILKFDSDTFGKGVVDGEYLVVHGYYENIAALLSDDSNTNINFFIPEKGATMYIDSFVLLKDSQNKDNAHKFIDFLHRPEVYKEVADYLETPSVNIGTRKLRETVPVYTVEDLKNATLLEDLGDDLIIHQDTWSQIIF